jgi:hypothetical protein
MSECGFHAGKRPGMIQNIPSMPAMPPQASPNGVKKQQFADEITT